MRALAWEQEPPKTHSVSRPFFDRGVGSSILASLSEAGGNDQHSSLSKPLPPRSRTCESRLPDCVHDSLSCMRWANRSLVPQREIPLFLLTFRLSHFRFHAFNGGAYPVSGVRSPSSGIALFPPPNSSLAIFVG